MAIFKAKVETQYTVIPNATAQDKDLSFEARGLLALMLSLPDDWEIHKSWLQKQAPKCGRDKMTKLMKELQDNGYVTKQIKQSSDTGLLDGVDWFVYPTAQLKTRTPDLSDIGETTTTKETLLTKKINNKALVRERFQKPSIEDIHDYMVERSYNSKSEAEKLYDYYESNGWYVGKKPMKCWKAAVRNWLRNAPKLNNISVPQKPIAYDIQQDFDLL